MLFPFSIKVAAVSFPLHAIFEFLAFFIGFQYYRYLRKRTGDVISSDTRIWVIIGAIFGALIGSRLVGGLENPQALLKSQNIFLYFYFNKTVLGGLLGGLFGVELVKKIIGEKTATGDLFVYPIILALIIGRIGCFSMGVYEETYGIETRFFTGMDLGDGLKRHPVTLYEIVFLAVLWIFVKTSEKRYRLPDGALFKIFLISYLIFRFVCDFIKPVYAVFAGLSTIQVACMAGLCWYYKYILHPQRLLRLQ